MSLKKTLQDDVKQAMRARDKQRLTVIRTINATIKQREIDDQTTMDDAGILAIIDKMIKQRRDAESQYRDAGRTELADNEAAEITILEEYLPEPLSDADIDAAIDQAIADTGASSMKDMGQVMGQLKPQLQGKADMSVVSQRLKARLQ